MEADNYRGAWGANEEKVHEGPIYGLITVLFVSLCPSNGSIYRQYMLPLFGDAYYMIVNCECVLVLAIDESSKVSIIHVPPYYHRHIACWHHMY